MLGPLAEPLLFATTREENAGDGGSKQGRGGRGAGGGRGEQEEGLSELWPRLSRVREAMEDLEASRTKVELARQTAVDRSSPGSIAHALAKVTDLSIFSPLL